MKAIKATVNRAVRVTGYHITKVEKLKTEKSDVKTSAPTKKTPIKKLDPKDYSTTDGPMEVPCQVETYFFTINNYLKPGAKALDVGSGLGYGLNLLSILAGSVSGIDIDKKAIDYSKAAVLGRNPKVKEIKWFDGYKTPYGNGAFDVITCVDVIEHVEKYDEFIDELLRISKGAIVFSTPNRRAEYTKPDGTPKNPWHLREWNHKELDDILKRHGAKVEWYFIDGPFDGPFKIRRRPTKDTLVLMPVLIKSKR